MRNILMLSGGKIANGCGENPRWEAMWMCKGKPKTTKQWELFYVHVCVTVGISYSRGKDFMIDFNEFVTRTEHNGKI